MLEKIKVRIFPFIIALAALSVSASAAFYSVTGLMKLFAGAAFAVGVMAGSLEVSKLVIASLLYQYWDKLNKVLKIYLTVAVVILILITSMGIYGFLSSAYQETTNKDQVTTQQITTLETKKKLYEDTRNNLLKEKQSLSDLRGSLSKGSTTQYTDSKGNLVVRSNNASIKQLDKASQSDDKLSSKVDIVNDSIFSVENQILIIKTNATSTSELGPLKYLSGLIGVGMDRIINWLLLIIIFVFDPLAIALVIAANFAFAQISSKKKLTPPQDLWDNTLMDGLEEEEFKELFDKADTNDDGVIDEEEAKSSNIDSETANQMNQLNQSLEVLEQINNENNYDFQWKKDKVSKEIENIKNSLSKQFNKDDDNTITYF